MTGEKKVGWKGNKEEKLGNIGPSQCVAGVDANVFVNVCVCQHVMEVVSGLLAKAVK